jgi:hypothetical protein
MTVTSPNTFQIGDIVHVNPEFFPEYSGRSWTVENVPRGAKGKNCTLKPVAGGRGLRIAPAYLLKGAAPEGPLVDTIAFEAILHPGTVVRYSAKPGTWVVVGSSFKNGRNYYRIFPLGGSDRGYRSVPKAHLEVIENPVLA